MDEEDIRFINACFQEHIDLTILNPRLKLILECNKESISASSEWLLTSIMTAVGSFASNIRVEVKHKFIEPVFLYSIILGLPGTKKSPTIKFIKEVIQELEKKFPQAIHINNSATIESLIQELGENSNAIQIHDEFNTLVESLGLYKTGGSGGSSYDRSIFNSIYNGDKQITRTTIKSTVVCNNPRLSILAAGHTPKIMNMLKKEKQTTSSSDGFITRFLFCAPQAIRYSLKNVPKTGSKFFDVIHLLTGVCVLNKNFKRFKEDEFLTFQEDAFDLLSDTFDSFDALAAKYQLANGFISTVYGKALGQLVRICGIMKLINNVCIMADKCNEVEKFDLQELEEFFDRQSFDKVIYKTELESAIKINQYFICQKLLLAAIPKDFDKSPIFSTSPTQSTANSSKKNETKELTYHKAILLSEKVNVFYDYNIFRGTENFRLAGQELELSGIGDMSCKKKENSTKSSNCFTKYNYNILNIEEQTKLCNALMKYQIKLASYMTCFDLKRSNSNSLLSVNKKNDNENDDDIKDD